ncbi:MAG: hypothetical protein LJE65_06370 [Desulfobacteraceae bacterium]|jgi:hypothetical protein|nr:hypothetical protein [Desulfobacteraceae bacterium]
MKPTCAAYREEMQLLALRRRLQNDSLTDRERTEIREQIRALESATGLDGR